MTAGPGNMTLIDDHARMLLPPLYSQEGIGEDAEVRVKLFCPWGAATWYLTEYSDTAPDGATRLAFGLCDLFGDGGEIGYVSIDELEDLRGPGGIGIERDLHWIPDTLRNVRKRKADGELP